VQDDLKKCIIYGFFGALIYFTVWMFLAFPYRLFPSDDRSFWLLLEKTGIYNYIMYGISIKNDPTIYKPVTGLSLLFFRKIWSIFSSDSLSTLLFSTVVSNSVIVFLSNIITFRITKSVMAAVVSMILYATSAWPANYFFLYSYAPFAAMLSLLALLFMNEAYLNPVRKNFFIALSGITLGLFFWASVSSPLLVGIYLLAFFCLFRPIPLKHNLKIVIMYCVPLFFTIALFIPGAWRAVIVHLKENIATPHYTDALNKFKFIPKSPFLSFFYIVRAYSSLLIYSFSIVCILMAILIIIRKYQSGKKIIFSLSEKVLFILVAVILLHSVTIDVLPFTKLGRTHFVVYPIFIIATTAMFHLLISGYLYRYKRYLYVLCFTLLTFVVVENVSFSSEMIHARMDFPSYLTSIHPKVQRLYMLKEDVHTSFIKGWLKDFNIEVLPISKLEQALLEDKNAALIIGPMGKDSGISVLRHSTLSDFTIENIDNYKSLRNAKKMTFPYYAYFPSFLFEEEISQALYFLGKVPDYEQDSKKLKLLLIEDSLNSRN